jgi:hypothetical protein
MFELVELIKANDKKHKWEVKLYNTETKKMNTVKFGAYGMEDYTMHKDKKRKQLYIQRHKANEDWTKDGINTAGWWAFHLLWSKPTIEESLKALIKRFNVKIYSSTS